MWREEVAAEVVEHFALGSHLQHFVAFFFLDVVHYFEQPLLFLAVHLVEQVRLDGTMAPGSTFKILSTYGPAIELGLINLATRILDEPYAYNDGTPVNNADMAF